MGLETGSFISALVSTNPVGATDPKSQGDDHIRFIKAKLLETFANVTGAVTASHTELNLTVGASQGLATLSVSFAALQTLVGQMGSLSASVTSSDITGSIRTPVLKTQSGYTAGTFTAATVTVNDKGVITKITSNTIANKVVQVVEATPYATSTSLTTLIPYDDTIPQNTEGTEIMTVTITPTSATNRLRIEFEGHVGGGQSFAYFGTALFQDAIAGAISARGQLIYDSTEIKISYLSHEMAAGTTSATTFKIRCGPSAGTSYVNGTSTGRKYGGVQECRLRVTEISV